MRLRCRLREFRGRRTLRDIATASGVSQAVLSRIETGRMLPTDEEVRALEPVYGHTLEDWYMPRVLVALEFDDEEAA